MQFKMDSEKWRVEFFNRRGRLHSRGNNIAAYCQCDKMTFIVFIICPFANVKNCPIVYKICQSR